jgi:hypothetical protein
VFATDGQAVDRIEAVLGSDTTQLEIRGRLAHRAELFTAEPFVHGLRHIVDGFTPPQDRI